jgi:hypothetical protein
MRITGASVQQRKKCLANLIVEHLLSLGKDAEILENKTNSAGHKDQVLVKSCIGLIHVTATESIDPNGCLPVADYKDGNQSFLADKKFVTFGWNTKDKRTFLIFVEPKSLTNQYSISKSQLVKLKNKEYSVAIAT